MKKLKSPNLVSEREEVNEQFIVPAGLAMFERALGNYLKTLTGPVD